MPMAEGDIMRYYIQDNGIKSSNKDKKKYITNVKISDTGQQMRKVCGSSREIFLAF